MKLTRSIIIAVLTVILLGGSEGTLFAQTFAGLGDGYDCATFSDGTRAVVVQTAGGFTLINTKEVATRINREIRKIEARQERLNAILSRDKSKRTSLVDTFFSFVVSDYPNSELSESLDDDIELKQKIQVLKSFFRSKKKSLESFLKRLKNCPKGKVTTPSGPANIVPNLTLVSFRGRNWGYAGFLATTNPLPNPYNKTPGGFNVCRRIDSTNLDGTPFVSVLYTGMGYDLCYYGQAVVEDFAVANCNALLPPGLVGLFIKGGETDDLSDEGLKSLEALVAENVPDVSLLALNNFKGSRDEAVELCTEFGK